MIVDFLSKYLLQIQEMKKDINNGNNLRSPLLPKENVPKQKNKSKIKKNGSTFSRSETNNDLATEYEDAIQQRLSGKEITCCDVKCSGKCDKYNHMDGKEYKNESKTMKGYCCIERMLDGNRICNYLLSGTIGRGSFSKVKLGIIRDERDIIDESINTNQTSNETEMNYMRSMILKENRYNHLENDDSRVAIKIIPRNLRYNAINKENRSRRESRIFKEALITAILDSEHIICLKDFFYNSLHFYMCYEYIEGESLLNLIKRKGKLNENIAKDLFKQIVCGVKYLHENAIVHRDLKIENILLQKVPLNTKHDNDGSNENIQRWKVKIIDFGLSNFYNTHPLNTFCGSLQFAAPELLRGIIYNGPEVDIWSLGIILFVMINAKLPFDDQDIAYLHSKIKKGKFKFAVENLDKNIKKLIKGMIEIQVVKRFILKQVEESEWLKDVKCGCNRKSEIPEESLTDVSNLAKIERQNVKILELLRKIGGSQTFPLRTRLSRINPNTAMINLLEKEYSIKSEEFLDKNTFLNEILEKEREEITHRFVKDLNKRRYKRKSLELRNKEIEALKGGDENLKNETRYYNDNQQIKNLNNEKFQNKISNSDDSNLSMNSSDINNSPIRSNEYFLKKAYLITCHSQITSHLVAKKLIFFFKFQKIQITNHKNLQSDIIPRHLKKNDNYECYLKKENQELNFLIKIYYNCVIKKHFICISKLKGSEFLFLEMKGFLKKIMGEI